MRSALVSAVASVVLLTGFAVGDAQAGRRGCGSCGGGGHYRIHYRERGHCGGCGGVCHTCAPCTTCGPAMTVAVGCPSCGVPAPQAAFLPPPGPRPVPAGIESRESGPIPNHPIPVIGPDGRRYFLVPEAQYKGGESLPAPKKSADKGQ